MGDWIPLEKRKAIGLKGYFTRTLLLFFVGIVVIFALAFIILFLCMEAGVIAPANAGEREARVEIDRQSESGMFTNDLEPTLYDYIYFDKEGNVRASSLEGSTLSQEVSRYTAENVTYGTGVYVFYEDGSRCLFTWRYVASFTNPTLQNVLPNAELIMLFLAVMASVLFFLLFVRSMGRKLGNKLALVENASKQIAQQDLDTPITTSVGINEFNHALQSMDDMRSILKDTLIRQWESEQQRKQEIAALAHDIKTPLTVINGNAELLLEDTLEEKQAALVNSIFSAGMRVQQYVGALQQVSIIDMDNEVMETIDIVPMLGELNAILSPLAKDKSISLEYVYSENLRPIMVYPSMLARALINIVENAIRFTKAGGYITISACQNEQETLFSVQDQGPGFSKTAIHHAKEMFWQQDTSRTGSRNYGIGLSIAEKVAQKHSGQLFLENTPQGACVKIVVSSKQCRQ